MVDFSKISGSDKSVGGTDQRIIILKGEKIKLKNLLFCLKKVFSFHLLFHLIAYSCFFLALIN